jgi:hypothetical protein
MGKPRDLANVVATGNILADGAVAPAELTGVTSTAAEINILDGVTATAAELNILDGVTATTAELNHVDGVTSNVQTQMNTKAPVADPTFTGTVTGPTINASTALQIGGTAITATAAELNKMDGVTVSASDINTVTAKAPTADPTFTGTLAAPTINASTKLQVNGTDVITNARQLSNIASVDATTAAAITTAGVGGANTFEATASGALSNGDPVIINANGTVSKPALTVSANDPATFGYTSNSNKGTTINGTGQTYSMSAAYNSSTGQTGSGAFLVTFRDASASDALKGNMMTIRTDGQLNVEGEFSIGGVTLSGERSTDVCFNEPLNKFFVAYRENSSSRISVRALTPNGARTVSGGSGYAIKSDTFAPRIATDNNDNPYNFVVTFNEGSDNSIAAKPFQFNSANSVITVGSEVVIESDGCSGGHTLVYDSTNDKFICVYSNDQDNNKLRVKVLTFDSSNNTISVGSAVELNTVAASSFNFSAVFTTAGKTVIAMRNSSDSSYLTTVVFTTSGTSGSFGTPQRVLAVDGIYNSIGYDSNTNRIGIAFKDSTNSNCTSFITGSVGTTSITFQSNTQASLGNTTSERQGLRMPFSGTNVGTTLNTARTGDNKLLVVFGTQYDYARVNIANLGSTSTTLTSTNYIGISDAAYSDGQTATVQTMGAIDDAQSSLTPAAKQYVQKDGTIGSSASTPSVEAGLALSATKLLVKG